jgi:carbonic anhydrase
MTHKTYGLVDKWLRNIKDVYNKHRIELDNIDNEDKRADRLTELNVIQQVQHLAETKIVQKAWHEGKSVQIHGWVYGLNSGLITELKAVYDDKGDIDPIYRYEFN